MKKDVFNLKSNPAVICYLEMIQGNINRMSNHSGIVKAATVVIITAVATLVASIPCLSKFWWTIIPIILCLAVLDSYYLALEKVFIDKYNEFIYNLNIGNINVEKVYDMHPSTTNLRCEMLARIIVTFRSFSIIGFYGVFFALSILIKLI